MFDRERCGTCAFWHYQSADQDHGQCRRFPPELFIRQRFGMIRTPGRAVWPDTASGHWCGEWKDRNERR